MCNDQNTRRQIVRPARVHGAQKNGNGCFLNALHVLVHLRFLLLHGAQPWFGLARITGSTYTKSQGCID